MIDPDILQEYRIVNGTKVLMLQVAGTIEGKGGVRYYIYSYANIHGVIAFSAMIPELGRFENLIKEAEELLNGFVVLE